MGDNAKATIGLALAIFAPGIGNVLAGAGSFSAGMSLGMMGLSASAMAIGIGTALVGSALAGSALKMAYQDAMSTDSYSGMKLQTQKGNTNPVIVSYGYNRFAGNIIFQTTNGKVNTGSDTNGYNRDYWGVVCLTGHDLVFDSDTILYSGSSALEQGSDTSTFFKTYEHIKLHNPVSAETNIDDLVWIKNSSADTATGSDVIDTLNTGHLSSNNTSFVASDVIDGDTDTGLIPSDNDYIEFDLVTADEITNIGVECTFTDAVGASLKLQYSSDGASWSDMSPAHSMTEGWNYFENTTATAYRYWRIHVGSWVGSTAKITGVSVNSNTFSSGSIPPNVSYMTVHQTFDLEDNNNTQLSNITVQTKGKKIKRIDSTSALSSSVHYSNNPAEILVDILINYLDVPVSGIDLPSFHSAKQNCDSNEWECNIAMIQVTNIQSVITDILATCRGEMSHSEGVWKLKVDSRSQSSIRTLDSTDLVANSLAVSMKSNSEIANTIDLHYINPTESWLSSTVTIEDSDLLVLDGGKEIEKTMDIKGCTNTQQATELLGIAFNSMRYREKANGDRVMQTPISVSFSTTVKHADLETGDLISINHDILMQTGYNAPKFVIVSVETDPSGVV